MAGNDDGNWISMIRSTDSSYGFRISDHSCLFEIVSGFTIGNHLKCLPGFLLKIRSMEFQRNRKDFPSSCEILSKFFSRLCKYWIFSFLDGGIEKFLDISFFLFEFVRITEIEQYECIVFRDGEEISDRTDYDLREKLHECIISIFHFSSSETDCILENLCILRALF